MGSEGPNRTQDGPRWARTGLQNYLGSRGRCGSPLFWPILGPCWVILGPPWPFLGGPGGHLEADLGFGRLASGVQGDHKLKCQKHQNLRKINVFGRCLEATRLQKACKEVVRKSCSGLEALKTATWMPCWLQDGLGRAKSNPRWPTMGPKGPPELSWEPGPLWVTPF